MIRVLRWILRTAILVVVALLVVRTVVEYAPVFMKYALVSGFVKNFDPVMQRLVERAGLPWSHDMRGLGLPGLAIILTVLRTIFDDWLSRLDHPPRRTAPQASGPAASATAASPPKPAAASATNEATLVMPQPVASATGTAYMPAYKAAPSGPPTHIGRYEIERELGRGAMGTVYKARDPKIGRTVAIKTISAVGMGPELGEYRERFMQEAKSAGRLTHPSVVAVYDVTDDDQNRPCLVLEFVEGKTLDKITAEKRLDLPLALDYVSQIARALAYAHSHGIIHRDVKPANIMVTASGQAKLSDFGIAKIEGTTLTVAGQVLGTPAFMSPEQCRGDVIDHRSDIFSLGAVLYLLATQVKPFPGETFTSVAYQVVHNDQVAVTQIDPSLPHELEAIIGRCLSKKAQDRYSSAAKLADDLDALRAKLGTAPSAPAAESQPRPEG